MADDAGGPPDLIDPDLPGLLDAVWTRLIRGVADRRAAARHLVLATAAQDGGAAARMVVLRGADRAQAELEVHTDTASDKVAELTRDPRASLLVWDAGAQLQIRMRAEITVLTGDAAAQAWARVPVAAARVYGGTPPPGTPIPAPEAAEPGPDPTRFAVLRAALCKIDVLHLGRARHLRAVYARGTGWTGGWRAP